LITALIDAALGAARARRCAVALLGLASRHPLAKLVAERYRPREYRSLLHLVHWDDGREAVAAMRPLLPHVEIAVL
jgi:hypothetical protein